MNKGFFVVFLGIILGAMALIFLNQTSKPTGGETGGYQTASRETERGATPSAQGGEPVVVASNDRPSPQRPTPLPTKPEVPAPEASRPEPPKPAVPAAEAPKPQPAIPDTAQPVAPVPGTPKTETPEPVVSPPAPAKPEAPKPQPPKPEAPKQEVPKPKPEPAKPEPQAPAMTPVTATPETPAKPGAQTRKALTLVNIGLHFKGNGMALRIEADAPFSYKTFALVGPDRYVVDLVGAWDKMRAPTVPSNNMVKGARSGSQSSGPRLVLDMQRAPKKHSVTWVSPTVLEIVIE